jgi:hypothetical protein
MSDYLSVTEVDAEVNKWLNFQLIIKPEQSGKTFIMIKEIINGLTEPIPGKQIINFILCDNNLLLTIQTGKRLKTNKKLQDHFIDGETYIELSSHERAKCHKTEDVMSAIAVDGVRNIICCTNGKRMDDIYKIISKINSPNSSLRDLFHFNIWLDEADKFIGFIDNTLYPLVKENANVNIKLITATADPLFRKYKYINVFPLETTTEKDKYHGWCDNDLRFYEKKGSYLEFAEHILTEVAKIEIKKGTKWFIPGLSKKRSHEAIKDMCLEKEMAVICVNGDGIVLTLPKTLQVITYKKFDEFNKQIIDIYNEHKLSNYSVVITGYICIGRGITIMSEEFMLDYAILSHCYDKCEASQIAGRLKGNIKLLANYKKPVVFTTEKFSDIAIEMETKSRGLALMADEKKKNGLSTVIGKAEYEGVVEPWFVRHEILFESYKAAKNWLRSKEKVMGKTVDVTDESPIHERDGYSVTSKLGKLSELTKENRIIIGKNDLGNGSCISRTKKGSSYLILPVYQNENSPPDSVEFQVRYYNKDIEAEHIKKEKERKEKGKTKVGGGSTSSSGGGPDI